MEKRATEEIRLASGRRLEGYAARFNTEARIAHFNEIIRPGAFRSSLQGRDILALVDHDASRLLARTKTGTMSLEEDNEGLRFSIQLPDTQTGRDVLALAERGDLGGMSFGFTVDADGEQWQGDNRELRAVNLHEISVVHAWPAYSDTSVNVRARPQGLRLSLARHYLEACR